MPTIPAGFFYRADGSAGQFGVASPADAIKYQSYNGVGIANAVPTEVPESPEIERAEQCTITHTFTMPYETGLTWMAFLYRGLIYYEVKDGLPYYFMVLSSRLVREKGAMCRLTLVSESKSFDSPPDEFSIVPVELGVSIIKHPRYFYAFLGDGYGSATEQYNQMVIRLLQDYFENPTANYRDALIRLIKGSIGTQAGAGAQPPVYDSTVGGTGGFGDIASFKVAGTDMAKRAALEIIQKYWRGTETPYVVGYELTWSQYYFISPAIIPGGFVENPITEAVPALPEYFYSRSFPPDPSLTIFDFIASSNPQCYSVSGTPSGTLSISWLRKSDQIEFQRTWFKITRTWLGTPIGYWDTELYSRGNRPTVSTDYLTINTG